MERKVASDYPQELLDLFHEYQHGDITRRTFLERAGKFAVGGLTVAAIFESLTPNYAWAQQVKPDDKRIKVGYEVVQSPNGNGSINTMPRSGSSISGQVPLVSRTSWVCPLASTRNSMGRGIGTASISRDASRRESTGSPSIPTIRSPSSRA